MPNNDFTLNFCFNSKIIVFISNFLIGFGRSIQNRLTTSGTDPTPTSTTCQHRCGTESEESVQEGNKAGFSKKKKRVIK